MFLPRPFTEPDRSAAVALAQAVGFGHLVVGGTDGFCSTPMPFLVDDEGVSVRGHLARPNPLLALLPADALLIVPGTDAYISPSWYPSKREHGRVVPTWNYEVVHLRGRLETRDEGWTEQLVRDLTDHHEADSDEPWSVEANGRRLQLEAQPRAGTPREIAFTVRPLGVPVVLSGTRGGRPLEPGRVAIAGSSWHPPSLPWRLPDVESEAEREGGLDLFVPPTSEAPGVRVWMTLPEGQSLMELDETDRERLRALGYLGAV